MGDRRRHRAGSLMAKRSLCADWLEAGHEIGYNTLTASAANREFSPRGQRKGREEIAASGKKILEGKFQFWSSGRSIFCYTYGDGMMRLRDMSWPGYKTPARPSPGP